MPFHIDSGSGHIGSHDAGGCIHTSHDGGSTTIDNTTCFGHSHAGGNHISTDTNLNTHVTDNVIVGGGFQTFDGGISGFGGSIGIVF